MRNALVGGRTAGVRTMLGGVSGLSLHAAAAALGVSALLATSAAAYATLKIVGIAYLLYLGVRMLRSARRPVEVEQAPGGSRWFAQGFVSNALNPKVALFFLTFVPQFLPDTGSTLPLALLLSAIFAALYLAWFSGLVALVARASSALRRPRQVLTPASARHRAACPERGTSSAAFCSDSTSSSRNARMAPAISSAARRPSPRSSAARTSWSSARARMPPLAAPVRSATSRARSLSSSSRSTIRAARRLRAASAIARWIVRLTDTNRS